MRIRRTEALAGLDVTLQPGAVLDVPDAVGEAWVEVGHAEPADGADVTAAWPGYEVPSEVPTGDDEAPTGAETATAPPAPEKAVSPNKRSRRSAGTGAKK